MTKKVKVATNKIVQRTTVNEPMSAEEKERLNEIERQTQQDFPPAARQPAQTGIAAQIRRERKSQGLTWDTVAQMAGIADADTVREIEYGVDAPISSVVTVAKALGLKLEAVKA
jgi:hypothetical protein